MLLKCLCALDRQISKLVSTRSSNICRALTFNKTNFNLIVRTSNPHHLAISSIRFLSTATKTSGDTWQEARTKPKSQSHIEQNINKKYGSRLIGWDPRSSNNGERSVIYDGHLKNQIRSLKLFSFGTTVMGVGLQAALVERLAGSSIFASAAVFGIVGFFTFITPVLIHLLAKRYVTELIYDPQSDTYTAATNTFFLQRNELNFKVEDVIVPTVPGLFTTIYVKAKDEKKLPLFLADVCFHDLKHFGRLMGFDKPIDFEISASDVEAALELKKSSQSSNTKL